MELAQPRSPGIPYLTLEHEREQADLPIADRWHMQGEIYEDDILAYWHMDYTDMHVELTHGPGLIYALGSKYPLEGFDREGKHNRNAHYIWKHDVAGSGYMWDCVFVTFDREANVFRVFHHFQDRCGEQHEVTKHVYAGVQTWVDEWNARFSATLRALNLSLMNTTVIRHMYNQEDGGHHEQIF